VSASGVAALAVAAPRPAEYRFGRGIVRVHSDDGEFDRRFDHIFSDCRLAADALPGDELVEARVSSASDPHWATLELDSRSGAPLDPDVLTALVPELGLRVEDAPGHGLVQRFTAPARRAGIVAELAGQRLKLHKSLPWQVLAGHFLVHHALRLQPGLLYLHAACVSLQDRGVLLSGPKGSGKSTLSLTLAGRGHGFLGDEVAVIEPRTRACLPLLRSVSLRPGPLGEAAAGALARHAPQSETLGDGTTRVRAPVSALFPRALRAGAGLQAAFFLRGFGPRPEATRFAFSSADLAALEPLQASFAQQPAGRRALELLRLLAAIPCYRLTAGGSPDATAALIETTLEAVWA
jgi:hypothetical protein